MKTKTFVLDTNVLMQSPNAMFSFDENEVVLPIVCLEELDKMKGDDGERGANARESIRILEKLRLSGNLLSGVALPDGGMLRIEANCMNVMLPEDFSDTKGDNRILKVCKGLADKGQRVVLVTKDIVVRLKAQMLGVDAEDFFTEQSPCLTEQYTGRTVAYTTDECMQNARKKGFNVDDLYEVADEEKRPFKPVVNQFVIIRSETNVKKTLLGFYNGRTVAPLETLKREPYDVKSKNVGQRFMQEALMRDAGSAPLVIVKGPAGTAKTFYALAVGLEKVVNAKEYRRILITRPNVQFDQDIGFLPGSEQEKIAPFLRPVVDNLEILVDRNEKERYNNERELRDKVDELFERGYVTAEALNFIRGRTIAHTYLIIDEAQNLTPKQAKGIITRVGKGTKIVLLGDPAQIDHPFLDERTNGLSYASERMKGSPLCFQLTMLPDECERSQLAFDAAGRM
ncbi:MAG: PhoH family protein [Betaproteobacteria bacterium]|nr:PhoH family protein [Betaproteobacteria bacterium]